MVLFDGFQAELQHVEDYAYIDCHYQQAKHVRAPAQKIGHFEGDVKRAGEDG